MHEQDDLCTSIICTETICLKLQETRTETVAHAFYSERLYTYMTAQIHLYMTLISMSLNDSENLRRRANCGYTSCSRKNIRDLNRCAIKFVRVLFDFFIHIVAILALLRVSLKIT